MIKSQYESTEKEGFTLYSSKNNNNPGVSGSQGTSSAESTEAGKGSRPVQYYTNGHFYTDSEYEAYSPHNSADNFSENSSGISSGKVADGSSGNVSDSASNSSELKKEAVRPSENKYRNNAGSGGGRRKRIPAWAKALIIIGLIILFIVLITAGCTKLFSNIVGTPSNEVVTGFGHDYIGVLYIEGTIDENGSGSYNHQYLLRSIDAMMYDEDNKGLILHINTPGGSVYASDELYLKIREYQEITERPVYSSMQSQATSGGYYISAPCDKIIANRNCQTGSIGVTMGSFVDLSGLLDRLGIKTETITSGENKAIGSTTDPMTDEQKAILQSLVDESYEQFVAVVSEGRSMSSSEVKRLADGRIYSAKQALSNGLIDAIGTYEEAVSDMMRTYGLEDCSVEAFKPSVKNSLSSLLGLASEDSSASFLANLIAEKYGAESNGEGVSFPSAGAIKELIDLNGSFRLSYICGAVQND